MPPRSIFTFDAYCHLLGQFDKVARRSLFYNNFIFLWFKEKSSMVDCMYRWGIHYNQVYGLCKQANKSIARCLLLFVYPVLLLSGSPAAGRGVLLLLLSGNPDASYAGGCPRTWVVLQCAVRTAASLFDIVFLDATYWVESPAAPDCLFKCCGALPIRFCGDLQVRLGLS